MGSSREALPADPDDLRDIELLVASHHPLLVIDAEEALKIGIVTSVGDDFRDQALAMAKSFAAGPPVAIRLSKRALYRNQDASLREALEFESYAQNICSRTDDAKEGIKAFLEKREPEFKGE